MKKSGVNSDPVNNSVFGLSFEGEYVHIITKIKTRRQYTNTESGEVIDEVAPLTIQGFVLDMDDKFFYLGEDPMLISKAIKITSVSYIEISKPKSAYDDILDSIGNTPQEKEVN